MSATLPPGGRFDRTLFFGGVQWEVKASDTEVIGPGPNRFSDSADNVWVDAEGNLHLRITYRDGAWHCAELRAAYPMGHGTYSVTMRTAPGTIDRNAVLGFFTWSDDPAHNNREQDIEVSQWGRTKGTNLDFCLQPADVPGNKRSFTLAKNALDTRLALDWQAGRLTTTATSVATGTELARATFTNGVPPAGDERIRLNLWLFRGVAPASGKSIEVVLRDFTFTPTVASPSV